MNKLTEPRKYLVAGLLSLVSLALLLAPGQTTAQTTKSYNSVWQASKLLIATATQCDGTSEAQKIAIGVAAWKVTGNLTDGSYFKEIWSVAENKPEFPVEDCGAAQAKVSYGREPGLKGEAWLASIARNPSDNNQYRFTLSEAAVMDVIKPDQTGFVHKNPAFTSNTMGDFHLGITTSCQSNWCLMLTGAYSFSDYKDFPAANDGRERAHVTAVPLNWTVQGQLCANQADCQ